GDPLAERAKPWREIKLVERLELVPHLPTKNEKSAAELGQLIDRCIPYRGLVVVISRLAHALDGVGPHNKRHSRKESPFFHERGRLGQQVGIRPKLARAVGNGEIVERRLVDIRHRELPYDLTAETL